MPKAKYLNDEERVLVSVYHEEGYSNREIGRKIGRSEGVVRAFLKKADNYGIKKATKGNTKLSQRDKNKIKYEATKNFLNCTQIKNKLGLPVTAKHISHILRSDENIKWKKPKSKPMLKEHHKKVNTFIGLRNGGKLCFRTRRSSI